MTEFEERELDELIQLRLFLRDNRCLRFEGTRENFDALGRFLDEHSLPVVLDPLGVPVSVRTWVEPPR